MQEYSFSPHADIRLMEVIQRSSSGLTLDALADRYHMGTLDFRQYVRRGNITPVFVESIAQALLMTDFQLNYVFFMHLCVSAQKDKAKNDQQ